MFAYAIDYVKRQISAFVSLLLSTVIDNKLSDLPLSCFMLAAKK